MIEIKIDFTNLTAVYVGMSYLVKENSLSAMKFLPLFVNKDATIIDGISIYSKFDKSFDTDFWEEMVQLKTF